jgi:hypothetical protein
VQEMLIQAYRQIPQEVTAKAICNVTTDGHRKIEQQEEGLQAGGSQPCLS